MISTYSLSFHKIFWNSSKCTCKAEISGTPFSRGRFIACSLNPGLTVQFSEPPFLNKSGQSRLSFTSSFNFNGSIIKPSSWKKKTKQNNYYCWILKSNVEKSWRKHFWKEIKCYDSASNSYFHLFIIL